MPNKVAQSQIVAVRLAGNGVDRLLRLRVRLEAGDSGDLAAGWYVVNLPIQNIRAMDATDDPVTPAEVMADETRPFEERMAALRAMDDSGAITQQETRSR